MVPLVCFATESEGRSSVDSPSTTENVDGEPLTDSNRTDEMDSSFAKNKQKFSGSHAIEAIEEQKSEEQRKLSTSLKLLENAAFIFDTSAGGSSEFTTAYAEVRKLGSAPLGDIEWITCHGSPAGKIYAASLLRAIDPTRGAQCLKSFTSDDKAMVSVKSLEGEVHYTTAEIAINLLSKAPTILFDKSVGR